MAVKNKEKIYKLTLTAVLTALIFVMAFTPIGYLKIGTVSITFLMIPVVIGAIVGGPSVGTVLGLMFGATSFIQCFGMDAFGTMLMGISPLYTFITCIPSRVLAGWIPGLLFKALDKIDSKKYAAYAVSSVSGALLNTVFFVGFLVLFFHKTLMELGMGDTILAVIASLVTINAVVEAIVCLVAGTAIVKALSVILKSRLKG